MNKKKLITREYLAKENVYQHFLPPHIIIGIIIGMMIFMTLTILSKNEIHIILIVGFLFLIGILFGISSFKRLYKEFKKDMQTDGNIIITTDTIVEKEIVKIIKYKFKTNKVSWYPSVKFLHCKETNYKNEKLFITSRQYFKIKDGQECFLIKLHNPMFQDIIEDTDKRIYIIFPTEKYELDEDLKKLL